MPKRRRKTRKRRTTRKKTTRKRSSSKKPIGYTKVKGGYKLVYGTRKNPKLGRSKYSKKSTLMAAARKKLT